MRVKPQQHKGGEGCPCKLCKIQVQINTKRKATFTPKEEFSGESPSIFVGRYGYPNINVGLFNVEQDNQHDNPLHWSKKEYGIENIIDLRTELINSTFKTSIKSFNDKLLEMSQEVAMARKPVDVEVKLSKAPKQEVSFNQISMPQGPRVELKKARITENPKIPAKIDKVVGETDRKASDALAYLSKHFDEHYLMRIMSGGLLGVKTQRKLVPTRWSITATDDQLSKNILKGIKQHTNQTDYSAYFGGYLGNYYLILFFPDAWMFELFEIDSTTGYYKTDVEGYMGRKTYAENTTGGYYAARLPVAQHLEKVKRQGMCLSLRMVTEEYAAPLGVWVCREASRKALESKPVTFASKELMLKYARIFAWKKFRLDLTDILNKSVIVNMLKKQKKIWEF
jgi:DNA repair protein NreA